MNCAVLFRPAVRINKPSTTIVNFDEAGLGCFREGNKLRSSGLDFASLPVLCFTAFTAPRYISQSTFPHHRTFPRYPWAPECLCPIRVSEPRRSDDDGLHVLDILAGGAVAKNLSTPARIGWEIIGRQILGECQLLCTASTTWPNCRPIGGN
ncbi:hypothetical protein BDW62DRAFT_37392 [Aspergillus aurantiobrunneus]